jgi:DNA-directed RNA polymerase subunit RPC12/RpoP
MKLYTCSTCKKQNPATLEHYYAGQIARAQRNDQITSLGKCSTCAKQYSADYSQKLKNKKLSRARKTIIPKSGTLYIIAPKDNKDHPYKIGITSGSDVSKRLTAIQTSHWLDMMVYYKSELIYKVELVEKMIHDKYKDKRVRGEWFNIDHKDMKNIMSECNKWVVSELSS